VKRVERLRSSGDFQRVRELAGRGWAHPLLLLHVAPNELDRARVGITVSGRVGKAVVRNKVRRRLREAFDQRARVTPLPASRDFLITARPPSAGASWAELRAALDAVLARAGVSRP
jgi:ribonuclease P protein component